MLRYLAHCASVGFSQRDTAIWLGLTPAAVAIKAHQLALRFHGKPGRYHKEQAAGCVSRCST
jgi:hypothetical protein